MKISVSRIIYKIEISSEQFEKLEKLDYFREVVPYFKKYGCDEVDYSGHYGNFIFLEFYKPLKNHLAFLENIHPLLGE